MSSPGKKQSDVVADKVLKRVEIRKMARLLQNRLRLAQFKTTHGWEDLPLDTIEPKFEEEIRRKRLVDGDVLSDSSSTASDLPYPTRTLMSSPLKATFYSDAIGSSNGSTGHRKRTYDVSFPHVGSSPSKRMRSSPTAHKSFTPEHSTWKHHHQLAQSSPIKPRRQEHFTTSTGPNLSFFVGSRQATESLVLPPNYAAQSDDDEDVLPQHSFSGHALRSSPPSTPPSLRRTGLNGRSSREDTRAAPSGEEEGADLLLYLAASPSPAVKTRMEPPSTPPPRNKMGWPSSVITPGGGNPCQNTPAFEFSDFVHMTPSPAQKQWKTPVALPGGKTPLGISRRRLASDDTP